jgi:iron complex transport system permease protein
MSAAPWRRVRAARHGVPTGARWRRWTIVAPCLILLCLLLVGASISYGTRSITMSPERALTALFDADAATRLEVVAANSRTPRALLAFGVGAALAIAGALLQALYRNPLASPGVTGVTQGAVAATVLWITFGPTVAPGRVSWVFPLVACVGGICTAALVWFAASVGGRANPVRLILMGVLVGGVLDAGTSIALLQAGEQTQALLTWLAGSLQFATWEKVRLFGITSLAALPVLLAAIPRANMLQMGDDIAAGLGQSVARARAMVLVAAVILTAAAVSLVGGVGFVGFVAPHLMRRLVGSDLRRLVPAAALGGAAMLLIADFLSRNLLPVSIGQSIGVPLAPVSLPVGLYLAFFGGPFFLLVLRKTR